MNSPLSNDKKKKLMARLNRASGQIQGIRSMVERDAACTDVAQQLAAARAALDRTYFELMACAIENTVSNDLSEGNDWQNDLHELTRTLAKYA